MELSSHEQQIDIPFLRVVMYSVIESLTWYVNSIQEMGSKATTFPSNFSLLIYDVLFLRQRVPAI